MTKETPRPARGTAAAIDFMKRQKDANKPFFCWMNTTRMHFRTHVRESMRDKPGINSRTEYADGMLEHERLKTIRRVNAQRASASINW
jgi:hypothetical protein